MFNKSYSFTFATGVSTIATFLAVTLFDSMDRSNRGGELFLVICFYLIVMFAFLLYRVLLQLICDKLWNGDGIHEKLVHKLAKTSLYDVFMLALVILFSCIYNIHCAVYLTLPFIVFAMNFLIMSLSSSQNMDIRYQSVFVILVTFLYFSIGLIIFYDFDMMENIAYLFGHFMAYAISLLLLSRKRKVLWLPIILICLMKVLYGRFSLLDEIFIPVYIICALIFSFFLTRKKCNHGH